jgi:hypothetical protein
VRSQQQQQRAPPARALAPAPAPGPQLSSETNTTGTTTRSSPAAAADSDTAALVARLSDSASPEADPDEPRYARFFSPQQPPELPVRTAAQYRTYRSEFESCYVLYIQLHQKIEAARGEYLTLEGRLLAAQSEVERSRARAALRATHAKRGDMLSKADRAFKHLHKHLAVLKRAVQEYQAGHGAAAVAAR